MGFLVNLQLPNQKIYMTKLKEIWKEIPNYEGLYKVSNLGRIKSLKRIISLFGKLDRVHAERILRSSKGTNGYLQVYLCYDGLRPVFRVHRIVAFAFVENPLNKLYVNHKDGNRQNNHVSNLEWCTKSENALHAYRVLGIVNSQKGKIAHNRKAVMCFDKSGKLINEYACIKEVEKDGFSRSQVSKCCKGSHKMHSNHIWRFKN